MPQVIHSPGNPKSAIDVIAALGYAHGSFDELTDPMMWQPHNEDHKLHITMVSHKGIMPEGDFYYKLPYEPLKILTEEALQAEVPKGKDQLLHRVFELLLAEFDATTPDYLEDLGEECRSISGFAKGYFSRRQRLGGLLAVKKDFAIVRQTMRSKITIPDRYVLLRAHMVFDGVLRHLNEDDWDLFAKELMPVFADRNAAAPQSPGLSQQQRR